MSPIFTCNSCAGFCSSESSESESGRCAPPNHFPSTSFSVATMVSRNVERNSRRSAQLFADIPCDADHWAVVRPLIAAIFIVTMGVYPSACWPSDRRMESSPCRWSSWMSKKIRFAFDCAAVTSNCFSRFACTRNSVLTRNAPNPSARTTERVWFAGRYRFATP